jgi:hypothetical protein
LASASKLAKQLFKEMDTRMAAQEIRDRSNKLLARITTLSNGKQELRNPSNVLKGTYDPKTNETRDPSNRLVAKGNVLATLM